MIESNVKVPNYNSRNLNAKQFMDWTGIWYDDLVTDEDDTDYYDILVSHFLPSLTDWEVEITVEGIYSYFFTEHPSFSLDRNYDTLVDDMLTQW